MVTQKEMEAEKEEELTEKEIQLADKLKGIERMREVCEFRLVCSEYSKTSKVCNYLNHRIHEPNEFMFCGAYRHFKGIK